MLTKLSVDEALMKAKFHAKKGEFVEAQKLYEGILIKFSHNKRAQQGLADLNNIKQKNVTNNPPQEVIDQLINLYKQNQLEVVVKIAQALTKQYPETFMLWNILGTSAAQIDMPDQAIIALKKVISLKPDYADVYVNLAVVLKQQKKLDEAIEACNKAVLLKPDNTNAYYNMGNVLKDQGKLDEAVEAYDKAISLNPDHALAYNNMGNTLHEQGKLDEAIEAYNKAVLSNPNYSEAYSNMGISLKDQGKLDEAVEAYNKAISLNPDHALAYNNMGNTLHEQGKLDEAIEAYNKAVLSNPNYSEAYSNMGISLKDQGKLDEAVEAYNKAISLNPDHALAYNNIGNALKDQGKIEASIEAYNKSISLNPDYPETHKNLGLALLQTSRIKEGLEEYEWRWQTEKLLPLQRYFSKPMWDGKANLKDKTILLWCEQGIGDTMNWSSCLPCLTSRAKHVILECQKKLVPLLSRSFPNVEVKVQDRSLDTDRDDFDLHLPMGSLYKHFIDEIIENDKVDAYLVPVPARVKFWRRRLKSLGKAPYIGVCWKSSVVSAYRLQHYPPISDWSAVLKTPDVTFINLQYTDYADDIVKVKDEFGVTIHNFDDLDQYDDIDDVAALCAALDMVVSTKVTPPMISAGVGTATMVANWRQSNFNNILNNPLSKSFKMIHRDTSEPWDKVFKLIEEHISRLKTKILYAKKDT